MQVIRTRSLASTLRRLAFAFVVFLILLVAAASAIAQSSPSPVPPDVLAQGEGVAVVDRGPCQRPEGPMLCMYGLHASMSYAMILVFNQEGVLVQVFRINGDQVERKLWQHPGFTG